MTEICVTLREVSAEKALERVKSLRTFGLDLVEIRMDHFTDPVWEDRDQRSIAALGIRNILTLRPKWEGGWFSGDEADRIAIMKEAIRAHPDHMDIELGLEEAFRAELIDLARKNDVRSIISYHDHQRTPDLAEAYRIMNDGFSTGADIVKMATGCARIEDSATLIGIAMDLKRTAKRYSIMGMGPFGQITRVLAPHMGCDMVYTKFDDADNVDQIDARTLKVIWERLGM